MLDLDDLLGRDTIITESTEGIPTELDDVSHITNGAIKAEVEYKQ